MIGRAFGILPTDPRIQNLSPFQSLFLYAHIMKERNEERDYNYGLVKLLCAMVNPTASKAVFAAETQERTENVNFEADLKAIDPNFDINRVKEFLEDDNG